MRVKPQIIAYVSLTLAMGCIFISFLIAHQPQPPLASNQNFSKGK